MPRGAVTGNEAMMVGLGVGVADRDSLRDGATTLVMVETGRGRWVVLVSLQWPRGGADTSIWLRGVK